ncbi:MAG: hypothetical protein LBJ67_09990 [Planctomycetaceae bacterium]|jgi:hypothetical protein|nr:hypothetical protein [Planctomycetaceae bacterium]
MSKKYFYYAALFLAYLLTYADYNAFSGETIMNTLEKETFEKGTFGYDQQYLSQKDKNLIVLSDGNGWSRIVVSPKYQAKVFTSSADGEKGKSLGFVNYKVFESGVIDEHMNGYGGENRFWLGPEGGTFSIYFPSGVKQVYDNWRTPKPLDTESWEVVKSDRKTVSLKKEMEVANYLGQQFKLSIDRNISLMEPETVAAQLNTKIPSGVKTVAYVTENSIVNRNDFEWTTETGTICIWMLDMFHPAPRAVTVIPFREGNEEQLGRIATSDYFGEIPSDRLKIKGNVIYLKTDGKYRSKLGLNSKRALPVAGNYDPDAECLTVITYDVKPDAVYLSQEWNPNKDPLTGDAMNAYNDGPLDDGSIMGPFLELESVSPAAFLKPNHTLAHKHAVYHFIGSEKELSPITETLFGVLVGEIKKAFE